MRKAPIGSCRPTLEGTSKGQTSIQIPQGWKVYVTFANHGANCPDRIAVVGAGQIGLGTDYPFPWAYTPVDEVMSQPGLSDADRIAILGGTMCKLLKIPA